MMKTKCILKYASITGVDALVLPYYRKSTRRIEPAFSIPSLDKKATEAITSKDFRAKLGEVAVIYPKRKTDKRLFLLGIGDYKTLSVEVLRRAYAKLASFCHEKEIQKIQAVFPKFDDFEEELLIQGVCEGLFLTNYVFEHLKGSESQKTKLIKSACFQVSVKK